MGRGSTGCFSQGHHMHKGMNDVRVTGEHKNETSVAHRSIFFKTIGKRLVLLYAN